MFEESNPLQRIQKNRFASENMKFLDVFSGIGTARLALEQLGWKCIGSIEIDKYAKLTYDANFETKNEAWHSDITKMQKADIEKLPDFDCLVAGFPCQAFSIAGKRRGFDDTRGTLIYDVFRILEVKKPSIVLLENVKGLLSHDEGRTFRTIIFHLCSMGYAVNWQVLNSKNFGVPQNRERVFIIGMRWDFRFPKGFELQKKLKDIMEENVDEKYFISRKALGGFERKWARGTFLTEKPKDPNNEISNTISARDFKGGNNLLQIGRLSVNSDIAGRVYSAEGLSRTLSDGGGLGAKTGLYAIKINKEQYGEHQQDAIFETENSLSPTLQSSGDGHIGGASAGYLKYRVNSKVRRLTPRECARLQALPDSFRLPCSDSQSYRQLGNAMTVSVVNAIGKAIEEDMLEQKKLFRSEEKQCGQLQKSSQG